MEEANKTNMSLILYMLPPEMLEKVVNFLNFKEICQAKLISRRWKEIIDQGNLLKYIDKVCQWNWKCLSCLLLPF